jgi:uracil-DNA glycosylase family 4
VGPADAEVAILGPSPGYHEVEEGEPFVGKDADLLLSTLEDLGVDWQDLWLQHVTRCGLPAGRAAPGVKWLRACREACFPSMLECEPKVIIALGNDAWKMLTDNSKASVTKQRGAVYKYKDIPIVCTWEPRACHKDPNKRAQFEEDLRAYILEDAWDKEEWDPQWELADRLPEEYDDIRGNVTLDVETISCDPEKDPKGALSVHRGQLNLTGIATRSDIPTLIEHPDAVAHNIPFSLSPPEGDRAWQDIRERLIFNPNVQLEGAGLQFDLQWFLLPHEMPLCTVEDICVKHYLLDDQAETRALKPLIRHYTNKVEYAPDNVRDLDDEDLHRYNAIDLYGTEMVSDGIDNDLLQSGIDYDRPFNLLRRVQPILAAMTRTGFPVMKSRAMKVAKSEGQKVEKLERALRKKLEPLEGRVLECKKRINARSKNPKKEGTKAYDKYMAGGLNFSSPPQMSEFVFGFWDRHANGGRGTVRRSKGLNLTPPEHLMGWKTQTDLFSCGEKYLSAVLDQDQTGFIEAYLALRAVRDNYKKYVLQFLNAIEDDGCVHPEYFVFKSKDNLYDPGNESGTGTGRLSAKNPSVHNTPKKHPIREAFVPFSNGWLLQMDWSTLEMVIQGYIADDPQLRKAMRLGVDLHDWMVRVAGREGYEISRDAAKTVNFGIQYGITRWGVTGKTDIDDEDVAQALIDLWYAKFSGVHAYQQEHKAQARDLYYVDSAIGRRRHFMNLDRMLRSRDPFIKKEARKLLRELERKAINFPIQSLGNDLNLMFLCEWVAMGGHKIAWPLTCVHDSVVFSADSAKKRDQARQMMDEWFRTRCKDAIMEWFGLDMDVPLRADVQWGKHWGDFTDERTQKLEAA